jgi:uncharacterized RDD family membrane protein YckC
MEPKFAGFWARFIAHVIDNILIGILQTVLFILFAIIVGISIPYINEPDTAGHFVKFAMQTEYESFWDLYSVSVLSIIAISSVVINWLYYAGMQSSSKQATLGKAAMGMIVVDENFERLTFARASIRYFSKFISELILYIGYIMAAFHPHKRALHDIIAGTYVIYLPKINSY